MAEHYPAEWMQAEKRKGHSFMPIPLAVLIEPEPLFKDLPDSRFECSCFGGNESVFDDDSSV